jgi:DNA primase
MEFSTPLYKQIFDEAKQYVDDENFDSSSYFTTHSDLKISRLASELVSDRYLLSKVHSKQIGEEFGDEKSRLLEQNQLYILVPRATTELKNEYILQKRKELMKKLKTADEENSILLIGELKRLERAKKELAKILGERIVFRY